LLDNNIEQYWRERDIQPHAYPGSFDLTTPPIGFVALAESMGVRGVKVEKAADVEQAVADMLDHDGPFLVHLITS
jgi:benzoylformate decarboxylase